jgi:hypothetical protein
MYQVFDGVRRRLLADLQKTLSYLGNHVVDQVLADRTGLLVQDLCLALCQLLQIENLLLGVLLLRLLSLLLLRLFHLLLSLILLLNLLLLLLRCLGLEPERPVLNSTRITL